MANDEQRISAGLFDLLDHPIKLLPETVDGACITRVRVARVGECVKLYVGALCFCATLPQVDVGERGVVAAEENNMSGTTDKAKGRLKEAAGP